MTSEPTEPHAVAADTPPDEVRILSAESQHVVRDPLVRANDRRQSLWTGIRWGVGLLILLLVVDRAVGLWQHDDLQDWDVHLGWLMLAAGVNVLGWAPAVIVWRRMLLNGGADVPTKFIARAYYAGHLGKYVPGKAAVLAVRAALLKPWGANIWMSMMTSTMESLATIASGLLVAFCLIVSGSVPGTRLLTGWFSAADASWSNVAIALAILLLLVPSIGWACSGMLVRFLFALRPAWNQSGRTWTIPWSSWMLLSLGWGIHGISYGLTLKGVTGNPMIWHDWPMWTAGVSWATSGAFFVFLVPGGLGVREGLLIEFLRLQPGISPRIAVISAVLLRLVWLLAEVTAAATLFFWYHKEYRKAARAADERDGSD